MPSEIVPLIPALEDSEKAKEFTTLMTRRNTADYMCYMALKDLAKRIGESILKNAFMKSTGFNKTDANFFYQEMEFALKNREDLNEKMLKLISGR